MRCTTRGVMVILLTLLFAWPAAVALANDTRQSFSLSPIVGGYLFDNELELKNARFYGIRLGYDFSSRIGAELLLAGLDTEEDRNGGEDVDALIGRLELLRYFPGESPMRPYLAAGLGVARLSPDGLGSDNNAQVAYGTGFKFAFSDRTALRLDVRHIIDFNDKDQQRDSDPLHNFEASGGLAFSFGGAGSTEAMRVEEEPTAIAASPADTMAETVTESFKTQDAVAVSEPAPAPETEVAVEAEGAPVIVPVVAAVAETAAATLLDRDGDRVVDIRDACPQTSDGLTVDERGCPELPAYLADGVTIRYRSASSSFEAAVEDVLKDLSVLAEVVRGSEKGWLIVEGHTDNVGASWYNLKLSQQRADSVRDLLVDTFSAPAERVTSIGYGDREPVAENNTQRGRQQNRRVTVRYQP